MILATGLSGSIGRTLSNVHGVKFRLEQQNSVMFPDFKNDTNVSLLHLASTTNLQSFADSSSELINLNIEGTRNLIQEFATQGGKRFIYASTGHIYGNLHFHEVDEQCIPNPISAYAEMKLQNELSLFEIATDLNIELVIARIFSVFGANMSSHYLAARIERGCRGIEPFTNVENADDVRDFLSPSQVGEYLTRLASKHKKLEHQIYNICSGKARRVHEMVHQMCPQYPTAKIVHQKSNMPYLVGNNDRLLKEI